MLNVFDTMMKVFDFDDGDFTIKGCSEGRIDLRRNRPNLCPTCKKIHEHENPFISLGKTACYFNCRRTDKSTAFATTTTQTVQTIQIKEEPVMPVATKPEEQRVEREMNNRTRKALEYYDRMTELGVNDYTDYIETDGLKMVGPAYGKLEAFPTDKEVIIVNAPCGSGKTEQIIQFIKKKGITSFIYLSTRQNFATSVSERLRKAGIHINTYNSDELRTIPKFTAEYSPLMISGESLHKVDFFPELLIIDESTTFFSQLDSKTHKEHMNSLRT